MSEVDETQAPLERLVATMEGAAVLDGAGDAIGGSVRGAIGPGALKDALSGTWLGHALHPMLTDVVIASFLGASLLDLLGGADASDAAGRLIGVGIAAYGPTAASGVNDWADSEAVDGRVRRVGLVHAATNATALALYASSLAARRRGSTGRARLLTLAGGTLLAGGGFLGGHMSLVRGVGVNQTAFDPGPTDWTPALPATELREGEPRRVVVEDTPVLLVRSGSDLHALHDRCSHRGCSLSEGEIEDDTVTCSCHGSRFALAGGAVRRGPASAPQPSFDVRESDGQIELRLAGGG